MAHAPPPARTPAAAPAAPAHDALRALAWWQPLPPQALELLGAQAELRQVPRHTRLLTQGEPVAELLVLLEGQVHVERLPPGASTPVLLSVARPGDTLGASALLEDAPMAGHGRAVRPCRVLAIPRQPLLQALHRWPTVCMGLAAQMSRQLRATNARVSMLACCSVEERVLQVLRAWAAPDADGQGVLDDPINQQDLALVVAASREMTSRALAQLKLKGLVWSDGWRRVVVAGTGANGRPLPIRPPAMPAAPAVPAPPACTA